MIKKILNSVIIYFFKLVLPFVKSIRIKEAKIKILNSDIPLNMENSFFLTSDKKENINYDSEDSELDEDLDIDSKKPNRVGSFKQNKNLAGQNIFFIKNKNELDASESVEVSERTVLKKSPSFVNLFKNKKKNGDIAENRGKKSRKSSLNGEEAISTKCASMWNCDWNLNNIREMHIKYFLSYFILDTFIGIRFIANLIFNRNNILSTLKSNFVFLRCNRRFLPLFATGLDADTEYEKAGKCFGF